MADAAAEAPPDMAAELKATKKLLKRMQLKEKGYKKMVDDLEAKVVAAQAAAAGGGNGGGADAAELAAGAAATAAQEHAGLVETLREEAQRAKDDGEAKVASIKDKAKQRETKIKDTAKGLMQPLKDENIALQAQLAAQADLQQHDAERHSELESLRAELSSAGAARAELETQLGSRAEAHDALAAEHASLHAAHDSESTLAAELAAASVTSTSASESLSAELAEVRSQLLSSEASLADVRGELAAAASAAEDGESEQASVQSSLSAELESLRAELSSAGAARAELETQLEAPTTTPIAGSADTEALQTQVVELTAQLVERAVALKAAEKAAKKDSMKAKALKAMLEEHSTQAEDQASATQAALDETRAAVEAEALTELNNYRDALGAARVKAQSLEGECIQLRESTTRLDQEMQEQRRVAKEWEGESTRLAEFVEKLSSTSSSSKKALVQIEMELATAKGEAKDSSQASSERDEFKSLSTRLGSELSNRDAELEELRIKLDHVQGLVGGSRDEAEAAESMYSKLQARLIETEAAKQEMAEALRKRVDIKTAEAAKHGATVERLSGVIESFQMERQQAEMRLQEDVRAASEARDAALQKLAAVEAQLSDHSLATVEQELKESELNQQALQEQNDTLERQCDRLRGMLEGAVARATTQQQEDGMFVDRRLVTKLLCNYISSDATGNQKQVLEVMARILQFDDDAKEAVGLGESSWSAYLPFGLGAKPPRPQIVKDGDIADEWANFLLSEIGGKESVTLGVKVKQPAGAPMAAATTAAVAAAAVANSGGDTGGEPAA